MSSHRLGRRTVQQALDEGDKVEELATSTQLLDMGKELLSANDGRIPVLMVNYAVALDKNRQYEESIEVFDDAIALAEGIYGKSDPRLIPLLVAQGHVVSVTRNSNAQRIYKRAMKLVAAEHGKDSGEYASLSFDIGAKLVSRSAAKAGRKYLVDAFEYYESAGKQGTTRAGLSLFHLGKLEFAQRDYRGAEDYLLRALPFLTDGDGKAYEVYARTLLIETYELQGKSDLATEHCVALGRRSVFDPDQEYKPLFRMSPVYPPLLLQARIEGYVDLRYTVDSEGKVRDVEIVDSYQSGELETPAYSGRNLGGGSPSALFRDPDNRTFDAAAIAAATRFRYAPRFENGAAVATEGVKTRLRFELVQPR